MTRLEAVGGPNVPKGSAGAIPRSGRSLEWRLQNHSNSVWARPHDRRNRAASAATADRDLRRMTVSAFPLQRALQPIIVVDDDQRVRESLADLLEANGMAAMSLASAGAATLDLQILRAAACLVVDVGLADNPGLLLQGRLRAAGVGTPLILMSEHADVQMSVRAMKAGAVDFLCKPVTADALLSAVSDAVELGQRQIVLSLEEAEVSARYAQLTERQKEVMAHVVTGLMNKQIAYRVGLSEITVKVHRSHLMHMMQARSVAELVHMAYVLARRPAAAGAKREPADPSRRAAVG
ncbi:MAG: response regulator transcription factor [Phenylobacterium sp.]|nr:MAG: response regulator transcription factor [Phenylobacterium sp.]